MSKLDEVMRPFIRLQIIFNSMTKYATKRFGVILHSHICYIFHQLLFLSAKKVIHTCYTE